MHPKKKSFSYAYTLIWIVVIIFSSCDKKNEDENEEEISVTDIDGNVYATVIIANRVWFAENLRTKTYNNGILIPTGHNDAEWKELSTGAYAIYPHSNIEGLNTDSEVIEAYGILYNWYALESGNLCPTGWHVSTNSVWTNLVEYAGGNSIAGGKLKSTRTAPDSHPYWESPNVDATNEYGFSALPSGSRSSNGVFSLIGKSGSWWTSGESSSTNAYEWFMRNNGGYVAGAHMTYKNNGFSIRCVKDL
jgi:uncharacterized protein (TIGR02145 family)